MAPRETQSVTLKKADFRVMLLQGNMTQIDLQERHQITSRDPKMAQGNPRRVQDHPKRLPRGINMVPRGTQSVTLKKADFRVTLLA